MRETGTGQQVAQFHERLMMMMTWWNYRHSKGKGTGKGKGKGHPITGHEGPEGE